MAIEITIKNDTENPFLERRDVKFTVTSDGATPKANDVRTALAAKLKVPDKNILIEHIYQKMGLSESDCIAKVYKKSLVAEKEGEEKKSEPASDAPVEEKQEDVKAEAIAEEKKDTPVEEKQPEKTEEPKKENPAPEKAKEDKKE